MKNKIFFIVIILIGLISNIFPQNHFRSGVFLHHSTGQNIWASVPAAVTAYNTSHGLNGDNAVSFDQSWFPTFNNGWFDWDQIFHNNIAANIYPYFAGNKIIAIKSCFPSSAMEGYGSPLDTIQDPTRSTMYMYKWHWRRIIRIMELYPDNFFSIWTNVPQVEALTNANAAQWSLEFSTWAKDTLAAGLDAEYGAFPPNVFVFNYFPILVDENNFLDPAYATSDSDSHPNAAAAAIIAPLWIDQMFDAAIAYEGIIPVELTSFTVSVVDMEVILNWSTATELNNSGFEIQRKTLGNDFAAIAFVKGQGTTTQKNEYSFIDRYTNSGISSYRLKQIDFNGNYKYSKVVATNFNLITSFTLEQNYPNPFNPGTKIRFSIPKASNVKVFVYNSLGEKIATILDEYKETGFYEIYFDSSNLPAGMQELSTGIYFYKISTPEYSATKKMIFLK